MAFLQKNRVRQKKEILGRAGRRKTGGMMAMTVYVLVMVIMTAGCGKVEEPIPVELSAGNVEEMQDETAGDTNAESDVGDGAEGGLADQKDAGAEDHTENSVAQDAQSVGSTQLEGEVRSMDEDSFVICKHETWEEDGYSYAVAVAPGYEDESDLITIHTMQNCVYQYKTVKNSGMNPEDVSTRDGSFADVKEGLGVTIRGSWQDDGSFLADGVVLIEIV